jgi:hypothetical protein
LIGGLPSISDNSGGFFFFVCLADVVVFFFWVPAEPSAFSNTPATFFPPPLFFFIDEDRGENGSLGVLAMMEKSSGDEVGGGLSLGLWRCMCIINK